MTKLECPHVQTDRPNTILVAILVVVHLKITTVNLGKEFDESNPCLKYGRNWVINN